MTYRKLFFNRLHTFFLSPGDLILGGDFNCIDSELDLLHIKSDFSADKRCLSALSPISVLLIFFVRGIQKRSLLPGLIKIFPKLLVSIAFLFLPLSFSQFAGTNVFLALSPIMTLSIYFFPRLMFLFTEAVFGNLTVLFFPMMILFVL